MKRLFCLALACLMLCACTAAPAQTTVSETTVPVTTSGPVLRPGFYVPVDEDYAAMLCYIQLADDGTGLISIMGMPRDLSWSPEGAVFDETAITPRADGLILEDTVALDFTYTGGDLPEGFLPDPPAPGVYAVSSVSYMGNMEFHSTLLRENGYLELLADGTGTLVFEEAEYSFVLEGIQVRFEGGWSMILLDMSDQDTGGPAMVMGYTYDGVIEAESIAFRLLEGE